MNTPRAKKRFDSDVVNEMWVSKVRSGHASLGIHNPKAAIIFAQIVSEFSFLETAMELVFARIIGVDNAAPKVIFREIFSNAQRAKVMRAVLERTPHNKDAPDYFDKIIEEFSAVNDQRNRYVHGKWETCEETGDLYLTHSKADHYGFDTLIAEKIDIKEMQLTRENILNLWSEIYAEVGAVSPVHYAQTSSDKDSAINS